MIVKTTEVEDALCIEQWKLLVGKFNKIIENNPTPEKAKKQLTELKELSANSPHLTPRQREGINGRCDNYINGDYGKDAIKDAYKQPA